MLPSETLGWKLYSLSQCFIVLTIKNVFVKSNSNHRCCSTGLKAFLSLVSDSQALLPPLCCLSVQINQCCVLGHPGCSCHFPGSGWKNWDFPSPAKCLWKVLDELTAGELRFSCNSLMFMCCCQHRRSCCDSWWWNFHFSGLVEVTAKFVFNTRSDILPAAIRKVSFALLVQEGLQGFSKVTIGKHQE